MLVDLLLGRSFWGFQNPGPLRRANLIITDIALLDHLHLRIAIMAQAIIPCHLLLRCRVEVIGHLLSSLPSFMSCGPYGYHHACP